MKRKIGKKGGDEVKYKDRSEQRHVTETMIDLLESLKYYLNEETKKDVEIALRILCDTEVEGREEDDNRIQADL